MIVGRVVGWLFVVVALVALGIDIVGSLASWSIDITPLGQHWFDIHRSSLGLAQAAIQRYTLPELWDPVIQTVLLWPTWAVFGVLGVILIYLFRPRRPHRRGSRSL